jgi:CheY-like chemotaxis protein
VGAEWQSYNILVVEDQSLIAMHVEETIRELGAYTVGCAANVPDALTLIETRRWDAALLDIRLGDGQTAYPIAERLKTKNIPFAFSTGWDGVIPSRYFGVPVITKPFGHEEIANCLDRLMRPASLETEEEAAVRVTRSSAVPDYWVTASASGCPMSRTR